MKRQRRALPLLLMFVAAGSVAAQDEATTQVTMPRAVAHGKPTELRLKAAGGTTIDLRNLPPLSPRKRERPEREEPDVEPVELPGGPAIAANVGAPLVPGPSAPAPATLVNFDGLDFATFGAGHPPDTNGDLGPTYYVQAVNTAVGIYRKSDQVRVAAFTFDALMSQGHFGNLCDTDNFGDPVVLYDSFEDRWVITDFAFTLDGAGNVINPPGSFQCLAVSKSGDPVAGGWNFYSINTAGGLGDYPKFGIWPDGIYMSTNMFNYPAGGAFENARVYAFNKAQMYAGLPTVQVVSFDAPSAEFTLLPANARLQAGTPPPGSPNYYSVVWQFTNAVSIYKFHVNWNSISTSSFTGPFVALAPASWANPPATVPSQGGNPLDTLAVRLMMQNQYTRIGGVESLWNAHTVQGTSAAQSAVRYYQTTVTGGTVAATTTQAATHNPDATNRFMPSVAIDRAGNLALGYSTSSATSFPAVKYAGNLATDPPNAIAQTEVSLINGTGTQTGACGTTCTRWGDYSAMSLDPDGCTFWYANEYYAVNGLNDRTRIGSFIFPSCTPVTTGTVQGTVTAAVGGAPIVGATVALGSRTTTTNVTGAYQFLAIPSGTYPSLTASAAGFNSSTVASVVVSDGATTTNNFALTAAPTTACPTDTSQADFQAGVPTNLDLTTAPGDVTLLAAAGVDQQNTSVTNNGFGFNSTAWAGQTFTPAVTGQLTQVDLDLFCSGCTGTTPNLTVSIRATTGATPVPTGADLATATIPGFSSGAGGFFSAMFATPLALTAGTRYAIVIRAVGSPSAGTYAYVCSCTTADTNPYANGQRVTSGDSGATWTADATAGGRDLGFKVYMKTGFALSGNLVSSTKDANPPAGFTPTWSTLSWTAATPANTTLRFQAAASNTASGPFTFVGPDGTAATFFTTSGGSLVQFNGKRYLAYTAYLSTTDKAVTPTLNDVTACFTDTAAGAPPDLSIAKSDGGASVAPGGTVAYTLTYANSGGQAATGVAISETVPANTTFNAGASTAGWACAPNNNAGSACTLAIGTVAAASGPLIATFAVTVVNPVAAGVSQIANTATIANDGTHGADPTPGNNTASDTTPLTGAPDLSITTSDGGATVAPGGTVAYTLTYANVGNRGATGVVLTETVPANTTFNAGASTAGWGCAPNNNAGSACTLAVGGLAAGSGNQTATFAVTVVNPVPAGVTQIADTASIANNGANGTDPTPGNNSGSDTTPLTGAPDLSITTSDGGATVAPGGTVAYTLTYANAGNRGASGVVLTETVPANTTFNAGASTSGWVCAPNNNAGSTCTLTIGGLAAGGGTQTATFAVTVVNPVPAGVTQIADTASIADNGANGTDPTPGNNSGSDTTPLTGAPDLSITTSDGGATVAPGGTVGYALTYANAGNRGATGVVLTETVPANTTFNAGASTSGWVCAPNNNAGSTCTLTIGGLAAGGGNQTATFAVTVINPVPAGVTQIADTASIADNGANGTDPTPGNNTSSDTTPVTATPDLSITKGDGGVSAAAGTTLAYVLTYVNSGLGATGVTLTETVPAHTTFNPGASTAGWACAPNRNAGSTCTLAVGALGAGSGSRTATFVVTLDNPLLVSVTAIGNTATIADDGSRGSDPTPANNTASITTLVRQGLYYTVPPCRLVDTRDSDGPYGGPAFLGPTSRAFVAAGRCAVPAAVRALSFNITVTQADAAGNLRIYAAGTTVPLASVINYASGQTRANNGVVALGPNGDFIVESDQPTGAVHVIIDVNGYFQ